ncbi:MAG: DUF4143 domain-containing protein [Acidobacteria bacterium]|nr:DUF4143 domain-containing protein [Acidobacteriota bacterium]
MRHPRLGASWEGFILEKVIAESGADQVHFWATHNGAELELLLVAGGRRVGVEIKRVDTPRRTRSMAVALEDLKLDALRVVYPGTMGVRHRRPHHGGPRARAVPPVRRGAGLTPACPCLRSTVRAQAGRPGP